MYENLLQFLTSKPYDVKNMIKDEDAHRLTVRKWRRFKYTLSKTTELRGTYI